ncbi:CBM96 family carbohydrate-binding protein [Tengunoibacter tsumagoiensis]|uniref:Carbohydrate-binding module family 96 domain-containing protein n=1 Tax=Tengunoibacter tsumagoiensis TaxID=2014871 RepID=A0A401ZWD6_9CHLR|nr:hypothetical protein [Tengunoibacter tsumagoiensis]GCE11221.1 hypothetical protein KTT_10800 [Tengunoibacter tsumagoiensis]
MHAGCMPWKRYGAFSLSIISLLVLGTLAFVSPAQKAKADDLSSTYTWKQLKTGGGGFITGLVEHPTTANLIYARADVGGAYRWNASTQQWTQLLIANNVPDPSPSDYNVESIAVSKTNDQVVYIAVGSDYSGSTAETGRILKSTNQGATWSDLSGQRWFISGNENDRTGTERLEVDPNNDNIVYFGSRRDGLWVSTNGGSNWSQVSTSQVPTGSNSGDPIGVKFVAFDPNSGTTNGKTSRIYAGVTGSGIYSSSDGGQSWSNILSTGGTPYSGSVASDNTFYTVIAGGNNTLQKYNPGSNSWANVTPNGGALYVATDPFNSQRLFVTPGGVGNGNIWRSTDGGSHWDSLNISISSADIPWITNTDETNYMSSGQISFDPQNQNKLWFPEGTGVWNATNLSDATINWNFVSDGIEEFVATNVIAPAGGKPVTGVEDRNGFYHNNVDAYPTQTILTNKFSAGMSLDYSGGHPNFIVAESTDTRGINPDQSGYSNDGGQNWTQFSGSHNYSDLYGGNIAVSATDTNNIVWLPTNNKKPYYTNDQGASWTQGASGLDNAGNLHQQIWWPAKRALDGDKVSGGTFYLYSTSNNGLFYRSTDGGQTWSQMGGSNVPSSSGNDSHVYGQVHAVPGYAGHVWVSTAQGGLAYTTNGGSDWTKLSAVQYASAFGFGQTINGSSYPTVYMYGEVNNQYGIWRSTDQGVNWDLASQYPLGIYDHVNAVSGDMNIAGRVYVGFTGNGFVYGDSNASGTGGNGGNGGNGGTGTTTTLNPSADRDSWSANSGSSAYLDASQWTTPYMKFDLSSITGSISSAKLRVYRTDVNQGNLNITAYQVNSDSWSESDASTLPAIGSSISTVPSNAVGYVEFDVTSFVKNRFSNGQVSLAFQTSVGAWSVFTSRENSANKPQLVITTASTSNTASLSAIADRDSWSSASGSDLHLNASQWNTAYVKFDLSSLSGSVSAAKFRIYRSDVGQGNLNITTFQVNSDSWSESDASTLPAIGSSISTVPSNAIGYVEFDVTNFVKSRLSGGKVTLAFQTSVGAWSGFLSRENSSNQPQLVVTTS